MGSDFLEKARHSYRKMLDRARVDLATADLLTKTTSCAARTAVADIVEGQTLEIGEQITVEAENGQLIGRRGLTEVARFSSPPNDLLQAVEASYGIARGTVERVHDLAGVAEISLC